VRETVRRDFGCVCVCIDKRAVHCRAMKGHGAPAIRNERDRRGAVGRS